MILQSLINNPYVLIFSKVRYWRYGCVAEEQCSQVVDLPGVGEHLIGMTRMRMSSQAILLNNC